MITKLLRIEHEEFEYFKELEIHELLIKTPDEILNYFKTFYLNYSQNSHIVNLPTKLVIDSKNTKGDFRIMPCCIDDEIKSVKIIGTNEEEKFIKDKISVGKSFLIDKYDNYIYAMFDVCVLSSFRTAIISVLAYDFIIQEDKNIGIIGLGRIGFYTIYLLHKGKGINHFFCVEIDDGKRKNFSELVTLYMPDVEITFIDIEELNKKCSSVFVATNSKVPILNNQNSSNIEFISSVGADANNLSELSESLISQRLITTDSKQSMLLGDMKRWKEQRLIKENEVLELTEILNNKNSINNKKILFISTGVALQDALISKYIYDKLSKNRTRENK